MPRFLHPLYGVPRAGIELFEVVTSIPSWLSLSDRPMSGICVPEDFIGINIATAEDPAVDDYIFERLAELEIRHVRMDFSYSSFGSSAERLLNRLLDEGYQVMLDIFPPLSEAKILQSNDGAQRQWGDFVARVFNQFKGRVEFYEIGNTPNRGRWSGFSSRSYIVAWEIATQQATLTSVRLAGPNVSDFEPIFNAIYLSYMARVGRVPEVHTDNLFVERVVEPEAHDHRVLGRGATKLLKLNLIKKARILRAIGLSNGCPETMCSYNCWTIERLRRLSAWPEQKRVDYLVRYLALAASSGALRRVYWGPLICSRDGLVDDGVEGYPEIDHVSYYDGVGGELDKYRVTEGFAALKYAIKRFSGAQFEKVVHQANGLSLYNVVDSQGTRFLLCWGRDKMSWPLDVIFDGEDLDKALFFNACGGSLERPATVSEQPLFIEFGGDVAIPDSGRILACSSTKVNHFSNSNLQSIVHTEGVWTGACMLRFDRQPQDLDMAHMLLPDAIKALEETAVLRDTRNRVWNVNDPRSIYEQITVKQNRVKGAKKISYRFRPSKGRRHWNNGCEMLRRGVATPTPIAFYEHHDAPGVRESWYLSEYISGAFSVRDVFRALCGGDREYNGLSQLDWFKLISAFVCKMHNKEVIHHDLSAGNLLLGQTTSGEVEPMVIDIGRAKIGRRFKYGENYYPLYDLVRVAYQLDWPQRESFIACYEGYRGKPLPSLWRIAFHYYDGKHKLKKRIEPMRPSKR